MSMIKFPELMDHKMPSQNVNLFLWFELFNLKVHIYSLNLNQWIVTDYPMAYLELDNHWHRVIAGKPTDDPEKLSEFYGYKTSSRITASKSNNFHGTTSSQPQLIGFYSDFSEKRVKALRTERNGANITAQLIRFNIRTQKYSMSISGALYKFRRDHRLPLRSMIRNGAAMMSVVTALQRFLCIRIMMLINSEWSSGDAKPLTPFTDPIIFYISYVANLGVCYAGDILNDVVREVTLSELRDSIARLRERVKLVCRTRGSPPPRVHWLKDGVPLHPRRGLRIQHKRINNQEHKSFLKKGNIKEFKTCPVSCKNKESTAANIYLSGRKPQKREALCNFRKTSAEQCSNYLHKIDIYKRGGCIKGRDQLGNRLVGIRASTAKLWRDRNVDVTRHLREAPALRWQYPRIIVIIAKKQHSSEKALKKP
ncbi:hypothetical protein G5I_13325 [Acromyrmex echinatior]|uniref:Ig-like domain-containing protein n=1 Tax=Acromyrmex echinatior TaxID=103372 RepID=F4X4Q6_ACREC|nr:hypothetical protein G5I_13325 [Acromyrmex echinatior]